MKYVWASWGGGTTDPFSKGEKITGFRTKHIRGYGSAVTFSCSKIAWSSADTTYTPVLRYVDFNFTRA